MVKVVQYKKTNFSPGAEAPALIVAAWTTAAECTAWTTFLKAGSKEEKPRIAESGAMIAARAG
ncbi:MAG: hypothetical protein ABIK98_16220 [Pseudomonadota bacterium]